MQAGNRSSKILRQAAVTVLFFLILICWGKGIYTAFGDDLYYAQEAGRQPLGEFLRARYETWSSRVVIEAVMMPIIAAGPYVWLVLNTVIILILIWITADLFGADDKLRAQLIFFVLIWLIPTDMISSAGWMVTAINYLWPLALGLVAMRPLKHWMKGGKCAVWEYAVCPLCILYAANMEQMGAILFGVYLVWGVWLIMKKKRLSAFYFILLLFIGASLCFILSSPGSRYRSAYETERYFPEFEGMNAGSKLLMGFLETSHYYIAGGHDRSCFLSACLGGVLFLCFLTGNSRRAKAVSGEGLLWSRQKNPWIKAFMFMTALYPLAAHWMCAYFFPFLLWPVNVPRMRDLLLCLSENRNVPGQGISPTNAIVVQTICYLAVFVCTALTIYFLHGRSGETLLELLVLSAGFVSRIIIGFSPTIYASGSRTAVFCSMAVLIVILRNLQLWMEKGPKRAWKIAMGVYVGGCVICNIV